jgi:formiminotetrahydrofolate cyclodeaminase
VTHDSTGTTYQSTEVDTFLTAVASEQLTPAGGTCAAVVGATGTALCEMACTHTVENGPDDTPLAETSGSPAERRQQLAERRQQLAERRQQLARRRQQLLRLGETDAAVVEELFDEPASDRRAAQKRATGVPLTVAEACRAVLETAVVVTSHSAPAVRPDAVSGATFVDAALRSAVHTVRTNTATIDEASFVETVERRAAEIVAAAADAREEIGIAE